MDNEFEPLRGDVATKMKNELNVTAADEHVPEIERFIRTVKERTRCTYNGLPYKHMPPRMLVEMVYFNVFWINSFPPSDGVSATISPRTLMTGQSIDFQKHCRLEFGEYVQAHESHDNTMDPRTVGALALRSSGNVQGGYVFFSLSTGRRLHRNHWTPLPMPQDVIERVHALAIAAKSDPGLIIQDRYNDDDAVPDEPHIAGVNGVNENENENEKEVHIPGVDGVNEHENEDDGMADVHESEIENVGNGNDEM